MTSATSTSVLDRSIVRSAAADAVRKLDPRTLVHNPVMLIVEGGAALTTVLFFSGFADSSGQENTFA